MAYQFYVRIQGAKQGAFQGPVTRKGYEKTIAGLAFSQSVISPRDIATGQSSGKRQHKPIVITKEWDKTTPLLLNALATNEVIISCVFSFLRPIGSQAQLHDVATPAVTVRLTNASVISVSQYTASPDQLNQFETHELEDVAFTYQKIEWTYAAGGVTYSDDWAVSR